MVALYKSGNVMSVVYSRLPAHMSYKHYELFIFSPYLTVFIIIIAIGDFVKNDTRLCFVASPVPLVRVIKSF